MDGIQQQYSEITETWSVAIQCDLLLVKNEMEQISKLFEALPSQKSHFQDLENENFAFYDQIMTNSYGNIVHNGKTNNCAKFGQIIMDYAMYVAISMCICLGIHTSSYQIGHFVKVFFQTCCIASLIFFQQTSAQKMAPCKGISFFEPFSFYFLSKWGQTQSVDH